MPLPKRCSQGGPFRMSGSHPPMAAVLLQVKASSLPWPPALVSFAIIFSFAHFTPAPSPQLLLKHAGQAPPSHLLHLLLPSASNVLVPGVLMAGLFPPSDRCSRVSSPEPPSLPTLSAIATFHPSTPNLSFLLYFPHSTQHRLTSC